MTSFYPENKRTKYIERTMDSYIYLWYTHSLARLASFVYIYIYTKLDART